MTTSARPQRPCNRKAEQAIADIMATLPRAQQSLLAPTILRRFQ